VTDPELARAQAARLAVIDPPKPVDEQIDAILTRIFSEADTVGPHAREKLSGILKHYAKDPHPFRSCVTDNMKRFGPGRTEKVCATLKDLIRGTTRWRHQTNMSDQEPVEITLTQQERLEVLASLSDEDWTALEEVIG